MRRLLPVLIPLSIFIAAGIAGVDFGQHWDETEHLQNVRHSLATQTLLPAGGYTLDNDPQLAAGYYAYPSMLYWITLASAAPEILHNLDDVTRPELGDFVMSQQFRLRVRAVCVVISSAAILWLYLAVLKLKNSWLQALLASSFLAGSWELSYHSRWIAPDTIVMQFAALCLLCCAYARPKWAAVAVGLAAGTKYPAAVLLIPVCWTAWLAPVGSVARRIGLLSRLCFVSAATFLVTTPGAVLQPWAFVHWLAYQRRHYGYGTHWGYTVAGMPDHLLKVLIYESLVLFSSQPWLAAAMTGLGIAGTISLFLRGWRWALTVLAFPIIYTAYFATQRVMIVRNLLVIAPFAAILITQGAAILVHSIPKPFWRRAAMLPFAAAVVFNLGFTLYAATTIRADQSDAAKIAQLRDYIQRHPEMHFYMSGVLSQSLAAPPGGTRPVVALFSDESDVLQWPANTWNLILDQFGPLDVNFNYYPTWRENRIVVLDLDRARKMPVDSVRRVVESVSPKPPPGSP